MALVGTGIPGFLGIGEEVTWGTVDPRTKFVRIVSETLKKNQPLTFPHGTGGASRRMLVKGGTFIDGDVEAQMNFDGFGVLLKHALGGVGSTQQAATSAYEHVFTLADTLPIGLSLEVDRDKTSYTYEGCMINQVQFNQAKDDILMATFGVIGEDVNDAAATAETFPSSLPIIYPDLVVEWDDGAVGIVEWSMTINNQLSGGDRVDTASGGKLKQPVRTGPRLITGSFMAEFDDEVLQDKFLAAAAVKLEMLYTGAVIEAAETYFLNFTILTSRLTAGNVNITDPSGPIQQEFQWEGLDEGESGDELQVVLQNENTTIAA